MFCYKCGCENGDNNRFCKKCGTPLKNMEAKSTAYEEPVFEDQSYREVNSAADYQGMNSAPNYQNYNTSYNDPAMDAGMGYMNGMNQAAAPYSNGYAPMPINIMKDILAKPLYLITIIAFSASVLIEMIVKIMGYDSILGKAISYIDMISKYGFLNLEEYGIYTSDLYEMLYEYLGFMNKGRALTAIVGALPAILAAVAFWLIFVSAKDRTSPYMKTTGFTIIKVLNTIKLVLLVLEWLAIEAMILFIGLAASEMSRYYTDKSPMVYFILLMIAVMIGFIVLFIYYLHLIRSIGSAREAAALAKPNCNVSAFVGVIFIISGVFGVFATLTSLFKPVVALSTLCVTVYQICMGVLIFQIRGKMPR